MATVYIREDVTNSILARIHAVYEVDRAKIDNTLPKASAEFAEEVYSLLMPKADRDKVLSMLPEWMQFKRSTLMLRVIPFGVTNTRYSPTMHLALPESTLALNSYCELTSVPGVENAVWDGTTMTLHLAENWSALPITDKAVISKAESIAAQHNKLTEATTEARATMRTFLEQHRTLQSAMKAFGPALKTYIDTWLQRELDRVPPKRLITPKAAKEKIKVNIAKLVTKATTAQLNIS